MRVRAILVIVLLLGAGLGGVLYLSHEAAERLVHPARAATSETPASRGLAYQDVAFATADRLTLAGWWVPAPEALGTVVFLHGYGASKAQALAVAPFLHRAGFHVLAFDFRAHGESEGSHTTVGLDEVEDVQAAMAYLRSRGDVDPERVALFGWSMGAATAFNAVAQLPEVRAVVADSAFARLDGVLARNLAHMIGLPAFPFVPLTMHFMTRMTGRDVAEAAPELSAGAVGRPVLLIFGDRDHLSSLEHDGLPLARATGAHGTLWVVHQAGHVEALDRAADEYESRVVAFLRSAMGAYATPSPA